MSLYGELLYQDIEHHWQDNPGQYTSQELVTKDQTILQEIYGKTSRINFLPSSKH